MTPKINTAEQLWLKVLWLRYSFWFRWSHKPLCQRFHHDTVKIGTVYLCRGCTFLYAGIIITLLAAYPFSALTVWLPFLIIILSFLILPASYPPLYQPLPRIIKDILRLMLGSMVSLCILSVLAGQWITGPAMMSVLILYRRQINQVRMKIKQNACQGCPELDGRHICSGYRMQADASLLYERQASEWVMKKK